MCVGRAQYSISTTGSSIRLLDIIMRNSPKQWDPRKIDHTVIPDWYDHPGYLATQVVCRPVPSSSTLASPRAAVLRLACG